MLHACNSVLIWLVFDIDDFWIKVHKCFNELFLLLIHLALDAPVAVTLTKTTILALSCMVEKAKPSVLALVGQRVLMFPSRRAYEVERDGFQFVDSHFSSSFSMISFTSSCVKIKSLPYACKQQQVISAPTAL